MVMYEDIMVQGFQEKHGIDPRKLEEMDERWLAYQAEVLNDFMARARKVVARPKRLSAIVPGLQRDCWRWGLDVESWVHRGLIDDLYVCAQRFSDTDVHAGDPEAFDLTFFNSLPGRQNIRLFATDYAWQIIDEDPDRWRKILFDRLDAGLDGYCIWDGAHKPLDKFADIGFADRRMYQHEDPTRHIKLITIGDFRQDRYHWIEGF